MEQMDQLEYRTCMDAKSYQSILFTGFFGNSRLLILVIALMFPMSRLAVKFAAVTGWQVTVLFWAILVAGVLGLICISIHAHYKKTVAAATETGYYTISISQDSIRVSNDSHVWQADVKELKRVVETRKWIMFYISGHEGIFLDKKDVPDVKRLRGFLKEYPCH